jgi:hypothetical protein
MDAFNQEPKEIYQANIFIDSNKPNEKKEDSEDKADPVAFEGFDKATEILDIGINLNKLDNKTKNKYQKDVLIE